VEEPEGEGSSGNGNGNGNGKEVELSSIQMMEAGELVRLEGGYIS